MALSGNEGKGFLLLRFDCFEAGSRRELGLDSTRKLFLPPELNNGVLLGHLGAGVTGNTRGLDARPANFLPPSDVRAAERVRSKAGEAQFSCWVACFSLRRTVVS